MNLMYENSEIETIEESIAIGHMSMVGNELIQSLIDYTTNSGANTRDPFFPIHPNWNLVVHRQWIHGRKVYTITVSMTDTPDILASIENSVSARGPVYQNVLVAVMMRASQKIRERQPVEAA